MIRLPLVLFFSALLFSAGVYGVLARRNAVMVLMSIELMLNAVNVNLVAFASHSSDISGQVFALFVIAVAAAEVGHRARDRDPALPQPRDDQRRRGEPPQVVGRSPPKAEVVRGHAARRPGSSSTPGSSRCCPFASALLTLFFGKRTPGKGAVYGIVGDRRGVRVVARGALALRRRAAAPYEGQRRLVHDRAAAPRARHPRRRPHRQ